MIIVCLFSISAVSANEMDNTTDYGNNDFNQFSDETNYQSIEENSILSYQLSNVCDFDTFSLNNASEDILSRLIQEDSTHVNWVTTPTDGSYMYGDSNANFWFKINKAFDGEAYFFRGTSYHDNSDLFFYTSITSNQVGEVKEYYVGNLAPDTYSFCVDYYHYTDFMPYYDGYDKIEMKWVTFKVLPNNNNNNYNLEAKDLTKYYKGSEKFTSTLTAKSGNPISNVEIKIIINGNIYYRTTDSNGVASMNINLEPGKYDVVVEYGGEKTSSLITIYNTISANDITKIFRNETQYYATFTDSQGNLLRNTDVKFNINGVFYTRSTDANGRAKMNINLNPGTYIITAENPINGEKHSNTIRVLPNIVENYDLTKYYKNDSQYRVRLLDDTGKPVGAGVDVVFNINGVFYTRSTDANGYAKMNINLGQGTYIITADYKGLKASNTIKVLPILSANDLSMSYKDGSKFTVKLLDGQGRTFAGQTVTMNINGVFYERITDNNGVARLNINLEPGRYIVTSSYNGLNIANNVIINQAINPNPTNPSGNNSSSTDNEPYGLDKAIIIDIDAYDKYITRYSGNYKVDAYVYRNSNTGIDISLSNNKISGTGNYALVNKNYYTSSIYSNRTGTWEWSDWKVGEGVSGATFHRYNYWTNNFVVKKVAVKIIDGLSDDGYSFYPTCSAMPDVDSHGTTREYAIEHNMHYIQGSGDNPGGYVSYDSINGCYHL